jgi:hypothetical protein
VIPPAEDHPRVGATVASHPFLVALAAARVTPTRRLRRVERSYRRDLARGQRLRRGQVAGWAAIRAALRERGVPDPADTSRPRRWWQR